MRAYKVNLTNSRLVPNFHSVTILMQADNTKDLLEKYLKSLCVTYKEVTRVEDNTGSDDIDITVTDVSEDDKSKQVTNWHVTV